MTNVTSGIPWKSILLNKNCICNVLPPRGAGGDSSGRGADPGLPASGPQPSAACRDPAFPPARALREDITHIGPVRLGGTAAAAPSPPSVDSPLPSAPPSAAPRRWFGRKQSPLPGKPRVWRMRVKGGVLGLRPGQNVLVGLPAGKERKRGSSVAYARSAVAVWRRSPA